MNNLSITNFNRKHLKQSHEHKLAELIDEVRACVGADATLAAKVGFNPRKILNKFKILIEKVINNIKIERQQAILEQASQNIVDQLDLQLATITERSSVFQNYLELLASSSRLLRSDECEHSNALSDWLDEIDPLPQVEDFNQMPFQSLKADPNNVPRDFFVEEKYSAHTYSTANIDNFFLPEYVESKNEAEITEDILAKANELKNSPVKIYEWVRNNIEWQPTWGGQQTAGMTLDVLRGNAMDISTLLIALLRAAKIPARYVHGTVDIEINTFMNMAGNFDSLNAAIEFVSAGGVPVTGIISGGKISKVRMEHVWVEAAVPFYPSRGSKPVSMRNPIDRWIPLDGSAKQYKYSDGIDAANIVDIDNEQFINECKNSGISDENDCWIKNLNFDLVEKANSESNKKLESYIQGMTKPTVGDVIGGRQIIKQKYSYLPGSLPYINVIRGKVYQILTTDLQIQVSLILGKNSFDIDYNQKGIWPLYVLNQKNVTISFRPATDIDEKRFKALISNDNIEPEQLPSFIPSNIHVVPEIRLENKVIFESDVLPIGNTVQLNYRIHAPHKNYLYQKYEVIAGSYLAIGVVGSNISKKTFIKLRDKLQYVKDNNEKLNKTNSIQLTREDVLGNMYATQILGYYHQCIALTKLLSLRSKISYIPMPTLGTIGYEPYQKTIFGLIRGIEAYGLYANVYTVQICSACDGSSEKRKIFNIHSGIIGSNLESTVLEQMLDETNTKIKQSYGISAVSSLILAMKQGQKIYYISNINKDVMQNIKLNSFAINEIRQALLLGKHVITHTENIIINGFKGCGYIIIDPRTGEGAYKISGGKNGGYIGLNLGILLGLAIGSLTQTWSANPMMVIKAIITNPVTIVILSSIAILLSIYSIMDSIQFGEQKVLPCFLSGLYQGFVGSLGVFLKGNKLMNSLIAILSLLASEYLGFVSFRSCKMLP
ncbi:transglutaminase-like domain-containing protein [Snodgrassella alvi]|uniref:Transglutaminase-like domain-containing protein n=1 Tax=Snodgrassella alvi TaxID=1196083 RepID=A0A2N9XTG1_9NEIS|nr:transglutaminase-like domain-containing protein [Snodgrassella alvi]PIT52524.1 hypothetical protein BHC49_13825 [Snodgrassella alvi]